jgi:tRNA-dihydrouridine synthase
MRLSFYQANKNVSVIGNGKVRTAATWTFFLTATARRYFFFAIFSKRLIDGQLPMFMIGRTTPAAL